MEDFGTNGLIYSSTTVNILKRKVSSILSEEDKENQDSDNTSILFTSDTPNNPLKRKAHTFDMPMTNALDLSSISNSTYPTNNQLDSPRKNLAHPSSINHTFLLNDFKHVPSLDFGTVPIGQTITMSLNLLNPSEFGVANVVIGKILPKAAADSFYVDTHQTLVIPMQSSTTITVTFTPNYPGRIYGKLTIRLNKRIPLFCSLQGICPASSQTKSASITPPSTLRSSTSSLRQSGIKIPKLAKQPSIPQTSSDQEWKKRRIVYDSEWIPKQEAGFQKWLNFTLLGAHFREIEDETPLTQDRYFQLRQLAITRLESKIRIAASSTYHHPQTDHILYRLQHEITARRLTIRLDRPLHVDVGLQQDLMDLFNSYHPLWLTLAFEVVLGIRLVDSLSEMTKQVSNRMPQFLRRTIVERIVQDPAFKLKSGSEDVLAQLRVVTLVRCFMVVYFLDQAHLNRHVDHIALPCLFRSTSKIKRSKQMLIEICQRFLAQEGNVLRHLYNLEYQVQYQQTVLEEMDMQVQNLAVDLRDGVRLVRLLETLDPECNGLSQQLRLPAVSRLQKVHNVQVVLTCLQERYRMPLNALESSGITRQMKNITAKDVVDGHREKTLALLWQIISYFKLAHVVKVPQLEMEVIRIQQRRRFFISDTPEYSIDKAKEPIAWHLLEWCRVVCSHYNVPIRNFTASFADGKALCLMIHYYHPRLLEKWEIQWTTSDTQNDQIAAVTSLLANERANFALVNTKVKQLGQVPVLLPLFDSAHLPEEKCIMTFLAYLHSRLLGASREIHAAFILQHWWLPRFRRTRRKKRDQSARILQRFWASTSISRWVNRSIRQRVAQICKLQGFGRIVLAKREANRRKLAVQHTHRRPSLTISTKGTTLKKPEPQQPGNHAFLNAAIFIQRFWRRRQHSKQTIALWGALIFHTRRVRNSAVGVIQRWYHRYHVVKHWRAVTNGVFLRQKQQKAATTLQMWWKNRKPYTKQLWFSWGFALHNPKVIATLKIQNWWLMTIETIRVHNIQRKWFELIHLLYEQDAAAHTIATWWRSKRNSLKWQNTVKEALKLHRQVEWSEKCDASAVRIQNWWRHSQHFFAIRQWWKDVAWALWKQQIAAQTIQQAWAYYKENQSIRHGQTVAAITIQRWTRRCQQLFACRKKWKKLAYDLWDLESREVAACIIQRMWKNFIVREKWLYVVESTLELCVEGRAATRIQIWWRNSCHFIQLQSKWMELTNILWTMKVENDAAEIIQQAYKRSNVLGKWHSAVSSVSMQLKRELAAKKVADELTAKKLAEEVAANKLAKELAAKKLAEELAAKKLAEELAAKKLAEELAAKKLAEELAAKKLAEELAAKKLAEELAAKKLAEELAAKKLAEELAAKKLAEELAAKKLEEELAAEKLAKEVAAKKLAEESAAKLAEELAAKKLAEKLAAKKLAEELAAKLAEELAAKKIAEEVAAKRFAEEVAAKKFAQELATKKLAAEKFAAELAAKKLMEIKAAILIQNWWRRSQVLFKTKQKWLNLTLELWELRNREVAATICQRWWRKSNCVWQTKQKWTSLTMELWELRNQNIAAEMIQLWWKSKHHAALLVKSHDDACRKIQLWWRHVYFNNQLADYWQQVIVLLKERNSNAAIHIQTWFRTCFENKQASRVQAVWREMTRLLQAKANKENAAIQIQRCVRRYQQIQWWKCVVSHIQNQHAAAIYIQEWWRLLRETSVAKQEEIKSTALAPRTLKCDPVLMLQKWWRGTRVRRGCTEPITIMRHRVQAAQTSADVATLALRQQSSVYVQETSIPLRYRLKRALAILNTSPRLQEMLQAVHTLEMCTRLSKECCTECIVHRVPRLLYRAIRKCNRSRPHLELLRQLLQVCLHLRANDDLEGISMSVELWIDLMQMHRDSAVLFTLSAKLCKRAILFLREHDAMVEDTPRRLHLLHSLLSKKAKTKGIVDRVTGVSAKEHLHPQRAATMLQVLIDCVEK